LKGANYDPIKATNSCYKNWVSIAKLSICAGISSLL